MHRLEKEKIFYEEKIRDDRAKLEELESNPANLEKFAREHYLMKKDNEDVFIIGNWTDIQLSDIRHPIIRYLKLWIQNFEPETRNLVF